MTNLAAKQKVLMTVLTYPHPSEKYNELVCTAGITEEGKCKDKRPESYRPNLDSIRILGEKIGTDDKWRERRQILDTMPHRTLGEWEAQWEEDRTSLGIVRPSEVIELEVIKSKEPDWSAKRKEFMSQLTLFGPQRKPLRKIPYEFRYKFRCEGSDEIRSALCTDWELGVLFLKEVERLGSDEEAAESVRRKFFEKLCGPTKDTRFFMGTCHPRNTWMVLGVFYPPKITLHQPELF